MGTALIKSRWTRDLANRDTTKHPSEQLTAAEVAEVMSHHTGVRPTPEDYTAAMKDPDIHKIDLARRALAAREAAADEFDPETVDAAVAGAQAVIGKIGAAHVVLSGSKRIDGDPSSGNAGTRLTVIQITVTKVEPLSG